MMNKAQHRSAYEALRKKVDRIVAEGTAGLTEEEQLDLLRLAHELEVAHIALENQNRELQRTSRELEASRLAFWDLYESAPVAFVTLNPKGRIERANSAARSLLGRTDRPVIGRAFSSFVAPADRASYYRALNKIAMDNADHVFELQLAARNRRAIHVHVQCGPKFDGRGNFSHWHLAFFDISGQKQLQEDLRVSREKLELATRAGQIGIWRNDLRRRQSYWNEHLYRILGLAPRSGPEDTNTFFQFIHPDDRRGVLESAQAITKLEREIDLEFRIVRADDGRVRWLAAKGTIERDAAGRPVNMQGVNFDITDRKQRELELNENRERFRTVLEHSLDVAFRRNLQTQCYDYISPVIEQITGFTPDEIRTMTSEKLMALIHPEDRTQVAAGVEEAYRSGKGKLEFRFSKKDGGYAWMGDFFSIQMDDEGRPLYRTGVMRDISEQKETERKLAEQQMLLAANLSELEQSNAELSEYAYVVSHDLKAPLRAIRNYADFLVEDLEGKLSGEQQTYLEGLKKAVTQGDALIRDLLNFARIGHTREPPEAIDLQALVDEVCHALDLCGGTRVTVHSNCPSLTAERMLLKLILTNLISNGLKFNRSVEKRIELACRPIPGGRVELRITDNGIGIEPAYREQIFRVFQRLHSDKAYEGTGIGLAIVKKAAARLGGSIRLETTPGEGSTFIVNLPENPVK
jgi:PAS domain S-box-containing protein